MNIKTEEQQLADRAVSLIKRLGMDGLSDAVVNLKYKMEPYHNKISKETDHLELNHINVKCLKQLLEFHDDAVDIAYGHKLFTSVAKHKRELKHQKWQAEQWKKESDEAKKTYSIERGTTVKQLFENLMSDDKGIAAGVVYRRLNHEKELTDEDIKYLNDHLSSMIIFKFYE